MNNFVISLKDNKQRQEHIKKEFQGVNFSFFEAITPDNLDMVSEKYLPNLKNVILSPVEKACFLSHISLMRKCIDENLPYITIFEDDIFLDNKGKFFLENEDWLKNNFNLEEKIIIKLETHLSEVELLPTNLFINNYRFDKIIGKNICMAGYLMTNSACVYFLEKVEIFSKNLLMKPVDDILFEDLISDKKLKFYQINPAICVQDNNLNKEKYSLISSLEDNRRLWGG